MAEGETAVELCRVVHGEARYEQAAELRRSVLYEPFGIGWVIGGRDDVDPATEHVVALLDGEVVGYGRLVRHEAQPPQIRQLVVAPEARLRGVGSAITEALVAVAREAGEEVVRLDARLPAAGFYERLGFRRQGAEFVHATGVLHVRMELRIGR